MERAVRIGRCLTVTVRHEVDGRIAEVIAIAPEEGADDEHGARLLRHAAETVARVIERLPRGAHDTPVLMAQAWAYAAQQTANALRRAEEAAMAANAESAA